jgi:hypothetical protein
MNAPNYPPKLSGLGDAAPFKTAADLRRILTYFEQHPARCTPTWRRWIVYRADKFGLSSLVPATWNPDGTLRLLYTVDGPQPDHRLDDVQRIGQRSEIAEILRTPKLRHHVRASLERRLAP